jgi:hypothetical protein
MNFTQDQIDSLVRTAAKVAGGILTAHGFTAAATTLNSTNVVEAITGAVMAILAIWASHKSNAAPVAPATNVGSPLNIPISGPPINDAPPASQPTKTL